MPSPEEFESARRRIRARSWLRRARMVQASGEWCPREAQLLAEDSPELAENDLLIYQAWHDQQGLSFY
ncbi:MAG: hypothetical protein AB7S38_03120 [Vulcanimicrobiota bacterium]